MNRRHFIQISAASSLGLLLSRGPASSTFASVPKRVLVFGGTYYLGPAVVEALLANGHNAWMKRAT